MDETELLDRAARFMTAAVVELDSARQQALATTAIDAMIDVVRLRTGSALIPRDAAELVHGEVMVRVRERLLGIAKTAAPVVAGLENEAEIQHAWTDALVAAFAIKH
jgi:hypothetical protein